MKIPTLLLSPEESRDRGGILTPGITGPIRVVDGQYGKAWKTEESTTNLVCNPSAENNLGSITSVSGSTVTRDDTAAVAGTYSVKCVTPGAVSFEGMQYISQRLLGLTGSSRPLIGSLYLKGSGQVRFWLRIIYDDVNGVDGDSTEGEGITINLTNTWQRYVTPVVLCDPTKSVNYVQMFIRTSPAQAVTFWADAAQVEEKDYATSYCDGSLGSGYSWSGTPHDSSSRRAASMLLTSLSRSPFAQKNGTVIVRAKYQRAHHDAASQYSVTLLTPDNTAFGFGRWPSEHLNYPRYEALAAGNGMARPPEIPDDVSVTHGLRIYPAPSDPSYSGWYFIHHLADGTISGDAAFPLGHDLSIYTQYRLGYTSILRQNLELESVLFFDETLSAEEFTEIANMPYRWEWSDFMPRIGGVIRTDMASESHAGAVARVSHEQQPASETHIGTEPTILVTPDVDRDVSGQRASNSYGVMRVVQEGNKKFWNLESGTTNLLPNPSFEENLTGWHSQSGDIVRDTTTSVIGSASMRMTLTAATGGAAVYTSAYHTPVKANTSYTISFWIKATKPGTYKAYHSWRNNARESLGISAVNIENVTSEWQRKSYTVTTPNDPAVAWTYFVLYADQDNPQIGDMYWIDGVQFEERAYATSYTDGSLGTGYSWTGAAHASTSTRQAANIYFPMTYLNPKEGTLAARVRIRSPFTETVYIWLGSAGVAPAFLAYVTTYNRLVSYANGVSTISEVDSVPFDKWITINSSWKDGKYYTYIDNNLVSTIDLPPEGMTFHIYLYAKATAAGAYADQAGWVVFPRALTAIERAKVVSNEVWEWDEFKPYVGGAIRSSFKDVPQVEATHLAYPDHVPEPALANSIPLLSLPFNGNLEGYDRTGPITASGIGAIRYQDGGVFLEEHTTNLLVNPSAETSLLSTGNSGGSGVANRVQTSVVSGSYALELVCGGTSNWEGVYWDTYSVGTGLNMTGTARTFIASAYIGGYEGNIGSFFIRAHYMDGTMTNSASVQVTSTQSMQRFVTNTITTDPTKVLRFFRVYLHRPAAPLPPITFYADAAQLEEKSYVTTYADGSLGTGYSWTGSEHGSTSVRQVATVQPEGTSERYIKSRGEVVVRFYHEGTKSGTGYLVQAGSWQNSFFGIARTSNVIRTYLQGPSGTASAAFDSSLLSVGWHTIFLRYDTQAGTASMRVDNDAPTAITFSPFTYNFGTSKFIVGLGSSQNANTTIRDLLVLDTPLTDSERTQLVNTPDWQWTRLLPNVTATMRSPKTEPIIITRTSPIPL